MLQYFRLSGKCDTALAVSEAIASAQAVLSLSLDRASKKERLSPSLGSGTQLESVLVLAVV
ncbi:hypothetical protein AB0758_49370 [Tolypothrix bouteillei VB521301_2]|uniref:Uncharacterized protein n=1 Tax=Tolypothrix bouteillei VB521301 TaxID=1479485 RepID=A0A0C1R8Y8_9CYAN